jgi:hypothetical protein
VAILPGAFGAPGELLLELFDLRRRRRILDFDEIVGDGARWLARPPAGKRAEPEGD